MAEEEAEVSGQELAAAVEAPCVQGDTPCRRCGYNLRGVPLDRRCPECGTPVGLSIYRDLLRYSLPSWLTRLTIGCYLLAASAVLGACGIMFIFLAVVLFALPLEWIGMAAIIGWAGSLIALAGGWLLTAPDPSGLGEAQYGRSRRTIRICVTAAFLLDALNLAAAWHASPQARGLIVELAGMASPLVAIVALFAQLRYLGKLANRMPSDTLRALASFVAWGFAVLGGLFLLVVLSQIAAGAVGAGDTFGKAASCTAMAIMVGLAIVGLSYLYFLFSFSSALREQRRLALRIWATALQPASAEVAPKERL